MCCGHQRKERCSWQRNAPTARATSASGLTGVGRGATPQANIILNASVECHKQSRFHDPKVLKLSVSGLKGGHSGLDIGTPHLNAIQILVR